jgi:hypothetical protein
MVCFCSYLVLYPDSKSLGMRNSVKSLQNSDVIKGATGGRGFPNAQGASSAFKAPLGYRETDGKTGSTDAVLSLRRVRDKRCNRRLNVAGATQKSPRSCMKKYRNLCQKSLRPPKRQFTVGTELGGAIFCCASGANP